MTPWKTAHHHVCMGTWPPSLRLAAANAAVGRGAASAPLLAMALLSCALSLHFRGKCRLKMPSSSWSKQELHIWVPQAELEKPLSPCRGVCGVVLLDNITAAQSQVAAAWDLHSGSISFLWHWFPLPLVALSLSCSRCHRPYHFVFRDILHSWSQRSRWCSRRRHSYHQCRRRTKQLWRKERVLHLEQPWFQWGVQPWTVTGPI